VFYNELSKLSVMGNKWGRKKKDIPFSEKFIVSNPGIGELAWGLIVEPLQTNISPKKCRELLLAGPEDSRDVARCRCATKMDSVLSLAGWRY